ncbi:MAG: hypothetical protein PGN13_11380 [Patulibacter minatonensis]
MLFDTSSPGRRRGVQIIFGLLALLMGGGLVLFGVGGSGNDQGIVGALGNGQVDVVKDAEKQVKSAQNVLATNPKDEAAANKLALGRVTIVNNEAYDPATQKLTEDGQTLITQADTAWTNYLKLAPAKPDAKTAYQYVNFYLLPDNTDYAKASRALEAVLVTRKPTAGLYAQLAVFAIAASDTGKYKAARAKALELAESDERRTAIKKQLDDTEQQVKEYVKQQTEAQKKATQDSKSTGGDAKSTTPPLQALPNFGGAAQ